MDKRLEEVDDDDEEEIIDWLDGLTGKSMLDEDELDEVRVGDVDRGVSLFA